MAVMLALCTALAYGCADFAAGFAAKGLAAAAVACASELVAAGLALVMALAAGDGFPTPAATGWAVLAGVGSAAGTFALYHGLAFGRMSTVAPISAMLATVLPVLVGLLLGESLQAVGAVGVILVVPSIALVARQQRTQESGRSSGAVFGVLAGAGIALQFIGLDRAGSHTGAWPVAITGLAAFLLLLPLAARSLAAQPLHAPGTGRAPALAIALASGLVGGGGSVIFLAATGHGELAIVAVLSSLYPAVTVLLARILLRERMTRTQTVGLVASLLAIALVGLN